MGNRQEIADSSIQKFQIFKKEGALLHIAIHSGFGVGALDMEAFAAS